MPLVSETVNVSPFDLCNPLFRRSYDSIDVAHGKAVPATLSANQAQCQSQPPGDVNMSHLACSNGQTGPADTATRVPTLADRPPLSPCYYGDLVEDIEDLEVTL